MKNLFCFEGLVKDSLSDIESEASVFFRILEFICNHQHAVVTESIRFLDEKFQDERYFVGHNIVFSKGKKKVFKGRVFIASGKDILSFVRASLLVGDLRPLVVAPIFEDMPSYAVQLDDDGNVFWYGGF